MLEDVNDEIPLFTEREQETVLEGEPIGTKVTQVNAIDKDGTFPNNQVIFCIHISYNYCPNFHDNLYNISTISTIFNNIRNEKAQTDLSHFLIVMQHAVFLVRKRLDIFFLSWRRNVLAWTLNMQIFHPLSSTGNSNVLRIPIQFRHQIIGQP